MTSEAAASTPSHEVHNVKRLLVIGGAVALPLLLFAMTASVVMIFALRGNVAALEEEAQQAKKTRRALQKELAEVREAMPEPEPEPAPVKKPTVTAARPAPATYGAEAGPLKVQSVKPIPVCVFRVGGDNSLAACIKTRTQS